METKFYLKNGKEVKMGDSITHCEDIMHPVLGKIHSESIFIVSEKSIPLLTRMGIIVASGVKAPDKVEHYIHKALKRLGWNKPLPFLQLQTVYPAAVFNILLREVAIELDKKYDDHIENSPEIFVVSTLDGRISRANKAHIKNYRNFAAFRSVADAKFACRILRNYLREMYAKRK